MKKEKTQQTYVEPEGLLYDVFAAANGIGIYVNGSGYAFLDVNNKAVDYAGLKDKEVDTTIEHMANAHNNFDKLAKALQDIVEKLDISGNMSVAAKEYYHDVVKNAKQVLKDAGLK